MPLTNDEIYELAATAVRALHQEHGDSLQIPRRHHLAVRSSRRRHPQHEAAPPTRQADSSRPT